MVAKSSKIGGKPVVLREFNHSKASTIIYLGALASGGSLHLGHPVVRNTSESSKGEKGDGGGGGGVG